MRAVRHALLAMMLSAIPSGFAVPMATRSGEQRHASARDRMAEDTVEVILALQRHRGLHVFDAGTLETTGYFVAGNLDRSVSTDERR